MPPLKEPREEQFCLEYVRHGTGSRAVIAAGYKAKSWKETGSSSAAVKGSLLLTKTNIRLRIQELQEQRARKADVSDVYVLTKLKTIVARCLQDVRPILSKDGRPTGEYAFDSKGANTSLQMIGDYLQMWKPEKGVPPGTVNNTQINIYIPANERRSPLELSNGHSSHGSSSEGSAPRAVSPTGNGLALPSNGHH